MKKETPNKKLESMGDNAADFIFGRGAYAVPGASDEIWEDIIDGAIDDQHAQMEKVGMLPPEWKANHAESKRKKEARRAAKVAKERS